MLINAENLRRVTDSVRTPEQLKLAEEMFEILKNNAMIAASKGRNTASVSRDLVRLLDSIGMLKLEELATDQGFAFSKNGGLIWIKW